MPKKNKPDPVQLGIECAEYLIKKQRETITKLRLNTEHEDARKLIDVMEMRWEIQFWRAKALGTKLP